MMIYIAVNIVGICGTLLIVLAFFLLQKGRIKSDDMCYPVLNLVGALMILITLKWDWNLPTFVIECFWIAISLYGIVKIKKGFRN